MSKIYNTVTVNASSEDVWQALQDFHNLDWATGVVTKVDVVGEHDGSQIGAKRILNDVWHETMQSVDSDARVFTYSIDDGPGPMTKDAALNYTGRVQVFAITDNNTSFVEWQSTFDSADENEIVEFNNPVYRALLGALKNHFA